MKRYLALFKVSLLVSTLFLLLIPKVSASYGDEYVDSHYQILLASGGIPDKSWESRLVIDPGLLESLGVFMGEPPNDDEDNILVDPEVNPTNPWVPSVLFGIGIIVIVIIAVYIYKRKRSSTDLRPQQNIT